MAETKETKSWVYTHPTDHPDNNPPVTIVAEATDEDVKEYEIKVNAEIEKGRPPESDEPVLGPLKSAEPVDYEEKTVAELKEMAAAKGITIPWDANKGDIIKALKKGK